MPGTLSASAWGLMGWRWGLAVILQQHLVVVVVVVVLVTVLLPMLEVERTCQTGRGAAAEMARVVATRAEGERQGQAQTSVGQHLAHPGRLPHHALPPHLQPQLSQRLQLSRQAQRFQPSHLVQLSQIGRAHV